MIYRRILNFPAKGGSAFGGKLQILNSQQGVTMLLAILVLSALLAISFSLATVLLVEVKSSGDLTRSEAALYASTGVSEQAAFNIMRQVPCTGNCAYITNFSNYATLNGQPIISSTSTPTFQDKVGQNSSFTTGSKVYNFCPTTQIGNVGGNSGCGYGKVTLSYLPTGNTNPLDVYLCEYDPTIDPIENYGSLPCSDPNQHITYNTPRSYWLSTENGAPSDGAGGVYVYATSPAAYTTWSLTPGYQQELIVFDPSETGPIYYSVETFGADGTTPLGLPYAGQTSVTVNSKNGDVARKLQVLVPNSVIIAGGPIPTPTPTPTPGPTPTPTPPTIQPPTFAKIFSPSSSIILGSQTTLTFTITNPNGSSALTGLSFTDSFPTALSVASPNGLTNTCGGTPIITSTKITFTGGSVAASGSCSLSVNVVGTDPTVGGVTNTTNVITYNEGTGGSTASALFTVSNPSVPSFAGAGFSGGVLASSGNKIELFNGSGTRVYSSTLAGRLRVASGIGFGGSFGLGFIADPGLNRLFMFTPADGNMYTTSSFGSSGTGNGQFIAPSGVAGFSTGIYVVDSGNNRVEKFSVPSGTIVYQSQFGGTGSGNGKFNHPTGIVTDSTGANVYVVDTGNNRVEIFNSSGVLYQSQFGGSGSGNGKFNNPTGIMIGNSGIYVVDTGNNRVEKFNSSGVYQSQFGGSGSGNGKFNGPNGISIDTIAQRIYVNDVGNNRVQVFNYSGVWIANFGL
ncbi:MAG: 6-bladed beta-propeller [Candidatus Doudnabacteria bacterium]|nr:6-bladed beta-propeller [Candidatus Doudnabacteria bacterium]